MLTAKTGPSIYRHSAMDCVGKRTPLCDCPNSFSAAASPSETDGLDGEALSRLDSKHSAMVGAAAGSPLAARSACGLAGGQQPPGPVSFMRQGIQKHCHPTTACRCDVASMRARTAPRRLDEVCNTRYCPGSPAAWASSPPPRGTRWKTS